MDAERFFLDRAQREKPRRSRKNQDNVTFTKGGRGSPWRHTKTGLRSDLGFVLRSGWEANICRILKAYDIEYEFEPHIFTYPVKRGIRGYTPDIRLVSTNEWIEVKGYFDNASRIKIKRFKKYYPEEFANLTLIIGKSKQSVAICESLGAPYLFYSEVAQAFKPLIHNWEGQ